MPERSEAAAAYLAKITPIVGRAIMIRISLIMIFTGALLFLTSYCFHTFLRTPPALRRGRWPYLALSLVLTALHVLVAAFDAQYAFLTLLPSYPPSSSTSANTVYQTGIEKMVVSSVIDSCHRDWITVSILSLLVLSTTLVDGLMLYRCWVVFGGSTRRWVVTIPAVVYVAGIAVGLAQLLVWCPNTLFTALSTAWFGSSILFNVLVTSFITTRLVLANRALARALGSSTTSGSTSATGSGTGLGVSGGSGSHAQYTHIWAMLVEAAVPPTLVGLVHAVFTIVTNLGVSGDNVWLRFYIPGEVLQCLYFEFAVLAPVIIIFRVTTGCSFTHAIGDHHHPRHSSIATASSPSHVFSKPLAFASSTHSEDSDFEFACNYDIEKGTPKNALSSASEGTIAEMESPISPVAESPITDNELSPIEEVPRL